MVEHPVFDEEKELDDWLPAEPLPPTVIVTPEEPLDVGPISTATTALTGGTGDGSRACLRCRDRRGASDLGNQFHYFRLTADDRILWGGYDAVYHLVREHFPQLELHASTQLAVHNRAGAEALRRDIGLPCHRRPRSCRRT